MAMYCRNMGATSVPTPIQVGADALGVAAFTRDEAVCAGPLNAHVSARRGGDDDEDLSARPGRRDQLRSDGSGVTLRSASAVGVPP